MRNWFNKVYRVAVVWLKKITRQQVVYSKTTPVVPTKPIEVGSNPVNAKVAIIVGHNSRGSGAVNYLHESEFVFNSRVARKLAVIMGEKYGIGSKVFFRPSDINYSGQCRDVVSECKHWGASCAISLHFNSAGSRSALGCEVLIAKSATSLDNRIADSITDSLNTELGIKERRDDGVFTISSSHRGSGMIYRLHNAKIPCCLVEPCFADYRTLESAAIFENEERYVQLLAAAIAKEVA